MKRKDLAMVPRYEVRDATQAGALLCSHHSVGDVLTCLARHRAQGAEVYVRWCPDGGPGPRVAQAWASSPGCPGALTGSPADPSGARPARSDYPSVRVYEQRSTCWSADELPHPARDRC